MAEITLTFPQSYTSTDDLKASLQVGDIVYYVSKNEDVSGGFVSGDQSNIKVIGPVKSVGEGDGTSWSIVCTIDADVTPPTTSDFILFSKDNTVNATSLLGYYGSAKFKNDSTSEAELFSIGADFFESSK